MFFVAAALLAAAPDRATADQRWTCTGRRSTDVYPYGHQDGGTTTFALTVGAPDRVVIGGSELAACQTGATCMPAVDRDHAEATARNLPGGDPLYSQALALDRRTGRFTLGGGGLDGGWRIAGTCTIAR